MQFTQDNQVDFTRKEFAALCAFTANSTLRKSHDGTTTSLHDVHIKPSASAVTATNGKDSILLSVHSPANNEAYDETGYVVPGGLVTKMKTTCGDRRVRTIRVNHSSTEVRIAAIGNDASELVSWTARPDTNVYPLAWKQFTQARNHAHYLYMVSHIVPFDLYATQLRPLRTAAAAVAPESAVVWRLVPPVDRLSPLYLLANRVLKNAVYLEVLLTTLRNQPREPHAV
jgi:hypothetical protein